MPAEPKTAHQLPDTLVAAYRAACSPGKTVPPSGIAAAEAAGRAFATDPRCVHYSLAVLSWRDAQTVPLTYVLGSEANTAFAERVRQIAAGGSSKFQSGPDWWASWGVPPEAVTNPAAAVAFLNAVADVARAALARIAAEK